MYSASGVVMCQFNYTAQLFFDRDLQRWVVLVFLVGYQLREWLPIRHVQGGSLCGSDLQSTSNPLVPKLIHATQLFLDGNMQRWNLRSVRRSRHRVLRRNDVQRRRLLRRRQLRRVGRRARVGHALQQRDCDCMR